MGGEELLVVEHTVREGRATDVVDLDERFQPGDAPSHPNDPFTQAGVEDEGLGLGVLQQERQLVVEVTVVDAHRDETTLQAPVQRLRPLVRVVEVDRHARLHTETGGGEGSGEACGSIVEVAPAHHPIALEERWRVTDLVGDRLEYRGVVQVRFCHF